MYTKRMITFVFILLSAALAPICADLEQRTTIDVPQVFAISAGKNILIRVDSNEKADIRNQLILHTDAGRFPNGEISIKLQVDGNGLADTDLWLGDLVGIPKHPLHIWVTAGERILARQEVKLLIPQTLSIRQYTPALERGEEPGTIRARVTDQDQNGLSGVPCILRFILPGETPKALATTSDVEGNLLFHLPDGKQAGTAYFQLFTENLVSKQLPVDYSPREEPAKKPLAAAIAIPPTINLLATNTIPIIVTVYSRGEEKVPATVMLSVDTAGAGFAFVPSGTSEQEVALTDGMGKALFRVPRFDKGRVLHLAAYIYTQGEDGIKRARFIGTAEIRVQSAAHVTALVKPSQTSGALVVTVRDDKQDSMANSPLRLYYSLPDGGSVVNSFTTDHNGVFEFPLPKAKDAWTARIQVICGGEYLSPVYIDVDKNGLVTQWGDNGYDNDGFIKVKQRFIYNADGTITVADK